MGMKSRFCRQSLEDSDVRRRARNARDLLGASGAETLGFIRKSPSEFVGAFSRRSK